MKANTQAVLNAAASKVGVEETGGADGHSGNIIFVWNWWESVTGKNLQGQSYCAAGVSWCFAQANSSSLVAAENPHGFVYCPDGYNFFKNKNALVPAKEAQPGDVVFYNWNLDGIADHVGIVEVNHGTYLQTIEFNTSPQNAVGSQANGSGIYRRNRPIDRTILGVGRPNW